MQLYKTPLILLGALGLLVLGEQNARSQETPAPSTVQVHVVITDEALLADKELPPLQREDVKVKQGKTFLKVTQLIPAQGDNAALQLMILIDDTLNTSLGNSLNELKDFISAQPPSTVIGIGYMSNAGVNVVQNFTADHDLAVKAVRLPRGFPSTMDSPYLSLISLVKGWPQQNVRREVLMVTDGIDRLRGERPETSRLGPDYGVVYHRPEFSEGYRGANRGFGNPRPYPSSGPQGPSSNSVYDTMPTISIDAPSASEVSQRYNVLVYSLYAAGVGRAARTAWDLELGRSGLSKSRMKRAVSASLSARPSWSAFSLTWKICRRCSPISITWFSKRCLERRVVSNALISRPNFRTLSLRLRTMSGFPLPGNERMKPLADHLKSVIRMTFTLAREAARMNRLRTGDVSSFLHLRSSG